MRRPATGPRVFDDGSITTEYGRRAPGNGNATDDRWNDPSGTEPGADRGDGSNSVDSSNEWGVTDRADRPTVGGDPDDDRDDERDRIPLDLSGSSEDTSDGDDEGEDEYAPESSATPIEPGDPDLENALFVVLGAIAMVLVLARLIIVPL